MAAFNPLVWLIAIVLWIVLIGAAWVGIQIIGPWLTALFAVLGFFALIVYLARDDSEN